MKCFGYRAFNSLRTSAHDVFQNSSRFEVVWTGRPLGARISKVGAIFPPHIETLLGLKEKRSLKDAEITARRAEAS